MSKQDFLDKMESENKNISMIKWCLNRIEAVMAIDDILTLDKQGIVDLVIKLNPSSYRTVVNYLNVIRLYNKYAGNMKVYEIVNSIKRHDVWDMCDKPKDKYLSYDDFFNWIDEMRSDEKINGNMKYYMALAWAIYEGIYCDDMSVLKNLREKDVFDNYVILRKDDGESYRLDISVELATLLKEIGARKVWYRENTRGRYEIPINGAEEDSIFKIEKRRSIVSDDNNRYRIVYMNQLRKVTLEYLGNTIRPFYIYISGLMYRIKCKVEEAGFDLNYAFEGCTKYSVTNDIIEEELKRSHYMKNKSALEQTVTGFLNVF